MTKFIKLHRRKPKYEMLPLLGSSYMSYQIDWCDEEGPEFFFNINKIESFSDHRVNDINVYETADEILKELKQCMK